jgi:hypothetical protein
MRIKRGRIERSISTALFFGERCVKEPIFKCSMCGQCIVRTTGYACAMRCPKQLRNGPCGGSMNNRCEVYPERKCAWSRVYQRARLFHRLKPLEQFQPAIDWSLYRTSAWYNLLVGKINLSGKRIK